MKKLILFQMNTNTLFFLLLIIIEIFVVLKSRIFYHAVSVPASYNKSKLSRPSTSPRSLFCCASCRQVLLKQPFKLFKRFFTSSFVVKGYSRFYYRRNKKSFLDGEYFKLIYVYFTLPSKNFRLQEILQNVLLTNYSYCAFFCN